MFLKKLPNNYDIALKRTLSMRRTAAKNSQLKETLTDTFAELLKHDWIVPADKNENDSYKKWYLPFFVTKTAKPRVVYDGAATVGGESLNRAVLAGENLLNGLVDVLMRFRMGKYACVADVSKCFFQIKLPRDQQDWFHIIWFKDNNMDSGEIQIFRFTRHVWGINSSPYVALMALGVTNGHAKSVLRQVPQCDHAPSIGKIDIGSQPLPDSTALGLSWDPESDTLKISGRTFVEAATRREMASQLANQFDPLGIVAPLLLGGKLILQKVAASGVDWDDAVSDEVKKDWKKWLETSNILNEFCIPRNFLLEHTELRNDAEYQLHGFCDASDSAFSCAINLRGVSAGKAQVSFVIGKSKLVLTHQKGWVISRKELEAAKMLSELMLQTSKA